MFAIRPSHRFWLLTTFLLIWTLLLSACQTTAPAATDQSSDSETTTEEQAAETGSDADSGEEQVELRLWMHQNPSFIQANEEIIRRFEESHPNVTIKLESFEYDLFIQTLQTSMPAGTEADIIEMFGSWVCSYADGGRLAEVSDTIISLPEADEAFFRAQSRATPVTVNCMACRTSSILKMARCWSARSCSMMPGSPIRLPGKRCPIC
jgi:multiple sugar transport system substrate-binding protein